jgi:peptide/nickel transport system substrate-binding protein
MATLFMMSLAYAFVATDVSGADEPEETVLRIGFMQKVDSLNPNMGLTDAAHVFYGLVYDSLQSVGGDFGTETNLAIGWGPVSASDPAMVASGEPFGSVWGFNLTDNAQWHDGESFTADDVVFTINLNAQNYNEMWAYQPYAYFIDYAEKINDRTVRVHFFDRDTGDPMPVAFAESLFLPMVPEHMMREMTPPDIAFSWTGVFEDSDPPIVGTGPFMATENIYQEWLDGDQLTLVRNPNYHWGPDKGLYVQFDKLVMYFYDDATAMSIALKYGYLDVAQFPPQTYHSMKQDVLSGALDNIAIYDGLKCTQYWTEIAINKNTAGPNQFRLDPAVRQALAMATDKTYIVNNHYLGLADEGSTLISTVNEDWHYEPTADELYNFDIEAASQLLEDAGYRYPYDGADWREVEADSLAAQEMWALVGDKCELEMMIRREFPEERDIAAFLESQWALLGIDLEYEVMDEATLGTMAYSYGYDTMIWYWSADPDPNFMLFSQSIKAWNGWNDNMYTSDAYEENYSLSVMELDPVTRKVYVENAQRENYRDAYYIILAYPHQTYAWRTDTFTGWGDWSEEPCRSIDAFWGGNPIYFDLEPVPDVDPPTTYASVSTADGDNDWYVSSAEIHLSASDDSSGIDYTKYRVDGGAWQDYTESVEIATSGIHFFQYYSADTVGNIEDVQALEVKIDTDAPLLWTLQVDGIDFDSSNVTLAWSCTDFISGICLVEVSLDDDEYQGLDNFTTWTSEFDPLSTYLDLTEAEVGDHLLSVRVKDNAGLVSEVSLNFTISSSSRILGMTPLALGLLVAAIAGVAATAAVLVMLRAPKRGSPPSP